MRVNQKLKIDRCNSLNDNDIFSCSLLYQSAISFKSPQRHMCSFSFRSRDLQVNHKRRRRAGR